MICKYNYLITIIIKVQRVKQHLNFNVMFNVSVDSVYVLVWFRLVAISLKFWNSRW